MALWGNKDNLNIGAAGTVYVSDWDTYTVTGSGTTFTNFAAGDVIDLVIFKEPIMVMLLLNQFQAILY